VKIVSPVRVEQLSEPSSRNQSRRVRSRRA
jgi:hypothetical protein